ncbi:hypothetical protein HZC21_01460 [Candidatus Peregrinibacteria bacterium]|nr:hypothetical protein [Candidatus Peregrinibacteria bacterium]
MQLKKYIITVLLIAAFSGAITTVSALATKSDDKLVADVIGTAGTGATYELNPSKFFTSDKSFGQDLYENTYNRVKSQGSDIAVQRLLAEHDFSKEELLILVPGSNIGKLLTEPDPTKNLSHEDVEARRVELRRLLAEEKDLADLLVNVQMDTEPTEIFANGDESDSGFDLLVDLAVIEQILFGKTETVFGGGGPGAPAGSKVVDVGEAAKEEAEKEAEAQKETDKKKKAKEEAAGLEGGAPESIIEGEEGEQVGAVCPLNKSFNSEAEKAIEKEKSAQESADKEGAGKGAKGKGKSGGEEGAPSSGAGEEGAGEEKPFELEKAADWTRPPLCYGPFCLKIEKKYKIESSYLANANCIACHFEKINDAFKKTLDHNLIPSKATGNLFELPKCKRSFLNLKWNFILLPQPILTPPNDDLITKGDIIKNMVDFYEKYYDNPGRKDKPIKPDPDIEEEVAQRKLEQSASGKTPEELFREIRVEVSAKKAEAAKLMEETRFNSDAENQASQFKVLLSEIDMMNEYFKGFKKLYEDLISGADDSPCKVLSSKKTCE